MITGASAPSSGDRSRTAPIIASARAAANHAGVGNFTNDIDAPLTKDGASAAGGEMQRNRIHAIAQTGGSRSVVEHMAQMRIAAAA